MPAPGNAKDAEAIGELRGEIVVDVRRSARPRKKHDSWSLAAPVEHLEPNSLWIPARHRDEQYPVGRRIGPACPLGIGATPCCEHTRCDVAARQVRKHRPSGGSLRRGGCRGAVGAATRDGCEDYSEGSNEAAMTSSSHRFQYVSPVLEVRSTPPLDRVAPTG